MCSFMYYSSRMTADNISEFQIAQTDVLVPGLKPDVRADVNGPIVKASNLEGLTDKVRDTLDEKPWYKHLLTDVLEGKKSAVFIVSSIGVLTIFAATAAGVEFGIRHGRDLRELQNLLHPKKDPELPV